MSLTTQSASVPVVAANSSATGAPLMRIRVVNTSVAYVNTSVRAATERWSATSHALQRSESAKRTGRGTYGTGFDGSETYESEPASAGFSNPRPKPALRYSGL